MPSNHLPQCLYSGSAGEAALYVNDEGCGWLTALCDVQKPNVRNSLIAAGLEQAKKVFMVKNGKKQSVLP